MLGIITLLIALITQAAFLIFRIATKSLNKKAMHITRVAAFAAFSLLMITGVFWWGFRWMGLFLALAILAIYSGLYFIRKPKAEKQYKTFAAVRSFISGCVLMTFCIMPGILFPQFREVAPTGTYAVASQSVTFVDASRVDPYSQEGENRKLTVQFFYPSEAQSTDIFPLVVFSHGAFGYRGSNLSTYKDLASNGYVVCSIDHSFHSFFAQHTDGSRTLVNMDFLNDAVNITNGVYNDKTAYEKTHEWLALRAADMNFILDEMLHDESGKLPIGISSRINSDKIGLFGHSLGGATAAQLARMRMDVDAVAVIDGTMFSEETAFENGRVKLTDNPYPVPLLNLYNEDHYNDAQQQGLAYSNLSASAHAAQAYDVVIRGSGHLNFTDLPLFSPALASMLGIGSVDSRYCIDTMNDIVLAFFNHTLKGAAELSLQSEY